METLLDKINNTNETFFIYLSWPPRDSWVNYIIFKQQGIRYHKENTAHVSKKELQCHKIMARFL